MTVREKALFFIWPIIVFPECEAEPYKNNQSTKLNRVKTGTDRTQASTKAAVNVILGLGAIWP